MLTHLHIGRAGCLPGFPQVKIHLNRREYEAMLQPRSWPALADRLPISLKDLHESPTTELVRSDSNWRGFRLNLKPETSLIPLAGHLRGHCGIALELDVRFPQAQPDSIAGVLFRSDEAAGGLAHYYHFAFLPTNADFALTPDWLNRVIPGPRLRPLQRWARRRREVCLLPGQMWQLPLVRDGRSGGFAPQGWPESARRVGAGTPAGPMGQPYFRLAAHAEGTFR